MDLLHIVLALGGDAGNTVSKFNVTPAEIAVLRVLHGDDAVSEINVVGSVERTDREERARLMERYGTHHEGRVRAVSVETLFPGAAARVFHKIDELDIPEQFFVATGRKGGKTIADLEPDSAEAKNAATVAKADKAAADATADKAVAAAVKAEGKPKKETAKEKKAREKAEAEKAAQAAAAAAAEGEGDEAGIGEEMDDKNKLFG